MSILNILNPDVAFDGWAIAIIIFILTMSIGGAVVYKTKSKIRQKQKAGDDSIQNQKISPTSIKEKNDICQKQKAGNNANQDQTI